MIKVNNANITQADEIKKLLNHQWTEAYKGVFSSETIKFIVKEIQTIERIKSEIEDNNLLFLIASENSKVIVGLATAKKEENKIFLQRLYIASEFQRKGIGIELLNKVIENFEDATAIYLEAEQNNINAINFYKINGFKIIKKNQYELNGEKFNTLLMEKNIYNQHVT